MLGKTNIPEFCCFYDADNEVYGRTSNPHDRARTPGGSSGGEAAALAMGVSALGVGSDLVSSIRNPAAWCGVFGHKPSRGPVSVAGNAGFGLPPAWQLFVAIGALARTAADPELGLRCMAGAGLAPPEPGPPRRSANVAATNAAAQDRDVVKRPPQPSANVATGG